MELGSGCPTAQLSQSGKYQALYFEGRASVNQQAWGFTATKNVYLSADFGSSWSKIGSGSEQVWSDVTSSFNGTNSSQTITFNPPTPMNLASPDQSLVASSSAGSSYPVKFAANNAENSAGLQLPMTACTVRNGAIHVVSAGTCSITAYQIGDSTYGPAAVTRTFTIAKLPQTITFTGPTGVTVSTTPQTLSATSSAGGSYPVSFATSSATCTIDGTTLTVVSAGTCSITASQAGDGTYAPATLSRSITIMQPQATLLVANSNTSNIAKGATGITLSVSGGSGTGAINYSVSGAGCSYSSATKVLSVASNYKQGVTVSCSVTATQGSSATYLAATSAAKVFNFR